MFHKTLQRAFRFNRRERWGLIFLLGGLGMLFGLTYLFPARSLPGPPVVGAKPDYSYKNENKHFTKNDGRNTPLPLEPFDPHEISEQGWVERGISERTARTIRNYLSKGGRFRRAEDLQKIWGLDRGDYERLRPFVRIRGAEAMNSRAGLGADGSQKKSMGKADAPGARAPTTVDINRSDSVQWDALPGIGPFYARRIIGYRHRLGGFVHPDQIGETYQLPDSVFQRIRPYLKMSSTEPIRRISLNGASIDSLGRHPYIGFSKARLIVRYREQHGRYTDLRQLLDIETLDQRWLQRIEPYQTH